MISRFQKLFAFVEDVLVVVILVVEVGLRTSLEVGQRLGRAPIPIADAANWARTPNSDRVFFLAIGAKFNRHWYCRKIQFRRVGCGRSKCWAAHVVRLKYATRGQYRYGRIQGPKE